jgi:hypothetical protein
MSRQIGGVYTLNTVPDGAFAAKMRHSLCANGREGTPVLFRDSKHHSHGSARSGDQAAFAVMWVLYNPFITIPRIS